MQPDLNELMKQAQKMQKNMQDAQKTLAEMEIVGQAGGGVVKVTLNGRHECKKVDILPSLMDEDTDVIEDLIAAAINDATHKIERESKQKLSELTAGLNLPDGFAGE